MKRLILKAPEALALTDLTEAQHEAIRVLRGQFVSPMPGTVPHNGYKLMDCVVGDAFDEAILEQLDAPFEVFAQWQWDGNNDDFETLTPLPAEMIDYLPDISIFDEEGNQIGTKPAELRLPHKFAGWPI